MNLKTISFEKYKAFSNKQTLKIKPITILIGKNSSGKSAVAKLFTLLANSLSGSLIEPLLVNNYGVELGAEYIDLVYNKMPSNPLTIEAEFSDGGKLRTSILENRFQPSILEWSYQKNENIISLRYDKERELYCDNTGNSFKVNFKGFVPKFDDDIDFLPKNFNIDIDYIGPFRKLPERAFYLSGKVNFDSIGICGENAYSILAVSKETDETLVHKVGEWYRNNFDGWVLDVNNDKKPYYEIVIKKDIPTYKDREETEYYNASSVNLVDVGQGMNQALPLVVRANMWCEGSIIVMEQPELFASGGSW